MNNLDQEIWKPVLGSEVYQVSNLGRVKSFYHKKDGFLLKGYIDRLGYVIIYLGCNIKKYVKAHRVVATAFIPNPNNYPQVNHKNGVKTDNKASNLEWCTPKHNINHAISLGLINQIGENNPKCKLTFDQVINIRQLYLSGGYSFRKLGKIFNIGFKNISLIVLNEIWHDPNYIVDLNLINDIKRNNTIKYNCKLTNEQVIKIKELDALGKTNKEIAKLINTNPTTAGRVANGSAYLHVTE